MSISLTSIDQEEERLQHPKHSISSEQFYNVMTPVVYKFTIDLGIMAKKSSMLFDIIEQIVPAYRTLRTYPMIEFMFKDGTKLVRDVPIVLTNSSIVIQEESAREDDTIVTADLTFEAKSSIYRPVFGGSGNDYLNQNPAAQKLIENIEISYEEYIRHQLEKLTVIEGTGGEIEHIMT
jgi:hypothetical protein